MYKRLIVVLLGVLLTGYLLIGCDRSEPTSGVGDQNTVSGSIAGVSDNCSWPPPLNWQVRQELRQAMQDFVGTYGGGVLFGVMLEDRILPRILVEGEIERFDDLRVASLSKIFFSFITLREGLDLDTTIDTWFPADHYDRSNEITIRMLLSHKSGVPEYTTLIAFDQQLTPQEIVDIAYLNQPLDTAPGASWCYSNTNYILLGIILEAVTGQECETLLQMHFGTLAPSLYVDDGREADFPAGYFDPWPIHWSLPWTAGAVTGKAGDVLRGYRYITKQPEFETMQQWADRADRCPTEIVFGEEYGLGLEELVFDSIDTGIGHSGDIIARSFLLEVDNTIYFVHTTSPILNQDLNDIGESLISIVENQ